MQNFLLERDSKSSDCCIKLDDKLLQLGLVICYIQWNDLAQSHDNHMNQTDYLTKEFHRALEIYCQAVNTDCSLCSCECKDMSSGPKELLQTSNLVSLVSSSADDVFSSLHPASVAYLLHTTGTTGQPKLVQVPHCCVVPNVVDLRGKFTMSPDDIVFNAAPLTFDPSVVEVSWIVQPPLPSLLLNLNSVVDVPCLVFWSLSTNGAH